MSRPELAGTEIISGCRADGKPFCTVNVTLTDGSGYQGQLSPDEVRMMALHWLTVAEAAESDGTTVLGLQEMGWDNETVARFLMMQRENRTKVQKLARGE